MALSQQAKLVEVVLFLENRLLQPSSISKMLNMREEVVIKALYELQFHFDDLGHGLALEENPEGWGFMPRKELHDRLKKSYQKKVDARLSRAVMETLSIIAYGGPITRREIDNIRGVSSENIVHLLRERELIKVSAREDVPGKPCLYVVTKKFLDLLNIDSIDKLPRLSEEDSERFEQKGEDGHIMSIREQKNILKGALLKKKEKDNIISGDHQQPSTESDIQKDKETRDKIGAKAENPDEIMVSLNSEDTEIQSNENLEKDTLESDDNLTKEPDLE